MILAFLMAAQALLTPTTAPGERVCVTLPLTGLYYLRATAWDAEGNQSALSNQVTKTFPGGNPVCWENPTANIDGTPLADLAQVTLYYDTVPITGGGTPPPPPTVVVGATCPTCAVLQTTLHIGLTGQAIQLTWQGVATRHEIQVLAYPPQAGAVPAATGSVVGGSSWQWIPRRAGLYYSRVRACSAACGAWSNSHDQGFVFHIKLAPASGGGVE